MCNNSALRAPVPPVPLPAPTAQGAEVNSLLNVWHLQLLYEFFWWGSLVKVNLGTVWHFQFVWLLLPTPSPPEVARGLFGTGRWGAHGWLHRCLFVAVAYCWCCLISWLESYLSVSKVLQLLWYLERQLGLGSCQWWFLPLSPPISVYLSPSLFNHSEWNEGGRDLSVNIC